VVSAVPQNGQLRVTFADGDTRTVDHLLFGTGYQVDITRYPFLPTALTARIKRAGGYPVLGQGMESSVPGLHFLGAPAAWSFGPIMRFVSGGWYTSRALARTIVSQVRAPEAAEPAPVSAGARDVP
jgi:FAD-dependent urate hydroxylase